jgi:hypothetical protein
MKKIENANIKRAKIKKERSKMLFSLRFCNINMQEKN